VFPISLITSTFVAKTSDVTGQPAGALPQTSTLFPINPLESIMKVPEDNHPLTPTKNTPSMQVKPMRQDLERLRYRTLYRSVVRAAHRIAPYPRWGGAILDQVRAVEIPLYNVTEPPLLKGPFPWNKGWNLLARDPGCLIRVGE